MYHYPFAKVYVSIEIRLGIFLEAINDKYF